MTFQAAFFDMDGLFLDSEPQWHQSQQELCARYGYLWDDDDQRICIGGPLSRVGDYIADICATDMSGTEVVAEIIQLMLHKFSKRVVLMPGALAAVDRVSEIMPVALVSASPRVLMDAALSTLSPDLFAFTISADDVERTKPFPDPYLEAAKRMLAMPNNCVVFEDSLTGISSAVQAGCAVVAIPHYVDVIETKRVKVAKSLHLVDAKFLQDLFETL